MHSHSSEACGCERVQQNNLDRLYHTRNTSFRIRELQYNRQEPPQTGRKRKKEKLRSRMGRPGFLQEVLKLHPRSPGLNIVIQFTKSPDSV